MNGLQMISRRSLLFGSLLGAAGLAAHFGKGALGVAASDPLPLAPLIPERIGSWRHAGSGGLVVPPETPKADFYDQELQRIYISGEAPPMMLVIAYCARPQQGLLQIHDPRVCYPGAGFLIERSHRVALGLGPSTSLPAQSFTAIRPGRTEQVVYWTRVGDSIKGPSDDQHLAIIGSVMRGSVPDGVLVRISSLGEGPALVGQIRRFGSALLGALSQQGRELLLGPELASIWSGTAGGRG